MKLTGEERDKLLKDYIEIRLEIAKLKQQEKILRPDVEDSLSDSYTCNAGTIKWQSSNKKIVAQPGDNAVTYNIDKPEFKSDVVKTGLTPVFKLNKAGNKALKNGNTDIQKVAFYEQVNKIQVKLNKELLNGTK
jgi:hypothetical protein